MPTKNAIKILGSLKSNTIIFIYSSIGDKNSKLFIGIKTLPIDKESAITIKVIINDIKKNIFFILFPFIKIYI